MKVFVFTALFSAILCYRLHAYDIFPYTPKEDYYKRVNVDTLSNSHPIQGYLPYIGYMVAGGKFEDKKNTGKNNCGMILIDAKNDIALMPFHCLVEDKFNVRFYNRTKRIKCTVKYDPFIQTVNEVVFPLNDFTRNKNLGYSESLRSAFPIIFPDVLAVKCAGAGAYIVERGLPNSPPIADKREDAILQNWYSANNSESPLVLLVSDRAKESNSTEDIINHFILTSSVISNIDTIKPSAIVHKDSIPISCKKSDCKLNEFPSSVETKCEQHFLNQKQKNGEYKKVKNNKVYSCERFSKFKVMNGSLEFSFSEQSKEEWERKNKKGKKYIFTYEDITGPILKGDSGGIAIDPKSGKIVGLLSSIGGFQNGSRGYLTIATIYEMVQAVKLKTSKDH